jgi:hypothetical protein
MNRLFGGKTEKTFALFVGDVSFILGTRPRLKILINKPEVKRLSDI